jgi:Putative zinc-finger
MSCDFAHLDGSYVLGALSPAERQAFEQHLAGCAECARSVRELAGLPGLLARVDPSVLESPPIEEPVPDTLLPSLVRRVQRTQRRRTLVSAGIGTAAALTIAVGSIAVTGALNGDHTHTAATPSATLTIPAGRSMAPVGNSPVRARMAFESVAWGTRLDLTCTYLPDDDRYPPPQAPTYALFVHTRDGRTEEVATWRSLPDKTMRLAAATATSLKDITSVEVRTADGKPVLKLTV